MQWQIKGVDSESGTERVALSNARDRAEAVLRARRLGIESAIFRKYPGAASDDWAPDFGLQPAVDASRRVVQIAMFSGYAFIAAAALLLLAKSPDLFAGEYAVLLLPAGMLFMGVLLLATGHGLRMLAAMGHLSRKVAENREYIHDFPSPPPTFPVHSRYDP